MQATRRQIIRRVNEIRLIAFGFANCSFFIKSWVALH